MKAYILCENEEWLNKSNLGKRYRRFNGDKKTYEVVDFEDLDLGLFDVIYQRLTLFPYMAGSKSEWQNCTEELFNNTAVFGRRVVVFRKSDGHYKIEESVVNIGKGDIKLIFVERGNRSVTIDESMLWDVISEFILKTSEYNDKDT